MAAPVLPAAAAATGAGAAGAGAGFGRLAGQVGLEVLAEILANRIPGALSTVAAPVSPESAGFGPAGKYFLGPESAAAYEMLLGREKPRRELYNFISRMFTGENLFDDLPTTKEFINDALGRQLLQARDLTEREIQKIRAEKEYDYMARALEAQAGIKRQELESLGDIQRQRVQSGYQTSGDLLKQAISTMYAKEDLAASPVLQQLATAV